jgi:hypothetical protein
MRSMADQQQINAEHCVSSTHSSSSGSILVPAGGSRSSQPEAAGQGF